MVREKLCRTALNKSGIPGFDYCVNPYTGCSHGCVYCYATFMKKYSGHSEEWGQFVDAKVNLPEVLSTDVRRHQPGATVVGSVCDPYQPIEEKYQLSRRAIAILGCRGYPFQVLTKSALILRDIELLKQFPDSGVSVTITTLNEDARALFEPRAQPVKDRVSAVRQLIRADVNTRVFLGPLLPWFSDTPERLRELLQMVASTGVKHVMVDKLNYLGAKRQAILPLLRERFPEALAAYQEILEHPRDYAERLRKRIADAAHGFNLDVEVVF